MSISKYLRPSFATSLATLTLSLAVACGLTACSNDSKPSDGSSATAPDEVTTLRLSHFWPATSFMQVDVFEPWAKKLEADSGGRLKVQIYPSAQLSKPNVTYDAAAKGAIDIGSQAHGYTAGRFPLSQIAELPGLSNSATQMSCVIQTLYDNGTIASEYQDSHLLGVFGSGPAAIHTKSKVIKTPDDLKGLRIRQPSAVAGDLLDSMGAQPVGLPATDIYTSIQRGVVDGVSFPWDPFKAFKVGEVAKKHTNIPIYSSGLLLTMNKAKYDSLPDDLKKVIDDNSGMALAKLAGDVQDRYYQAALKEATEAGDEIVDIPDPFSDPAWQKPLQAGVDKYLASVKEKGLDADAVYAKAKEASKACAGK